MEPGSVHTTSPLTVLLDSSVTAQPAVNMTSAALVVDDRVDVEPVGSPTVQLHVLGVGSMAVPTGMGGLWFTATAPAGFVILTGANLSRTTYAGLFALWGTSFGVGDGSTTFGTPNPLGKVPVGKDASQTEFATLGQTGGAKTHALTTAEMPSHNHTQDAHNHTQNSHTHTDYGHNHGSGTIHGGSSGYAHVAGGGGGWTFGSLATLATGAAALSSTAAVNNATTATNQAAGSGTAHSILDPYFVVNFIVHI